MNAVELSGQAKIGAIIHDQSRVWRRHSRPRLPAQLPRLLQHNPCIPGFVPVLKQCATGSTEFLSKCNDAISVGVSGCVQDGVEAWQYHARLM
jgi:hypothetical protein